MYAILELHFELVLFRRYTTTKWPLRLRSFTQHSSHTRDTCHQLTRACDKCDIHLARATHCTSARGTNISIKAQRKTISQSTRARAVRKTKTGSASRSHRK